MIAVLWREAHTTLTVALIFMCIPLAAPEPPSFNLRQRIACASPACGVLDENSARYEIVDIAARRVLRGLGNLRPFGRRELAFEPIHEAIENLMLPGIERLARMQFPELRLGEHRAQDRLPTNNLRKDSGDCWSQNPQGRPIDADFTALKTKGSFLLSL